MPQLCVRNENVSRIPKDGEVWSYIMFHVSQAHNKQEQVSHEDIKLFVDL